MGPLGFEPRPPAPEAGILAKLDYGPSKLKVMPKIQI